MGMSIENAPEGDEIAELLILNQRMSQLLGALTDRRAVDQLGAFGAVDEQNLSMIANELLRFRRWRDSRFGLQSAGLFADPAWDMLLDLFVAGEEGRKVSVSSLCIAACTPATTALRWIKRMEGEDLVQRHDDVTDGRRVYLNLTSRARETMMQVLRGYPKRPGKIAPEVSAPG